MPQSLIQKIRQNLRLSRKNTKGFTMAELIVVIFLFATMATIAISSYINSTDTFTFLANYKNIMSSLRTVRSYAITNKQIGAEVPQRYGVKIEANNVIAFADDDADFAYTEGVDTKIKEYSFDETKYANEVEDSNGDTIADLPVKIFYASGTGELTIMNVVEGDDVIINKGDNKFISICFFEKEGGDQTCDGTDGSRRYIVIFQVSGLPEEFTNLSAAALK